MPGVLYSNTCPNGVGAPKVYIMYAPFVQGHLKLLLLLLKDGCYTLYVRNMALMAGVWFEFARESNIEEKEKKARAFPDSLNERNQSFSRERCIMSRRVYIRRHIAFCTRKMEVSVAVADSFINGVDVFFLQNRKDKRINARVTYIYSLISIYSRTIPDS